ADAVEHERRQEDGARHPHEWATAAGEGVVRAHPATARGSRTRKRGGTYDMGDVICQRWPPLSVSVVPGPLPAYQSTTDPSSGSYVSGFRQSWPILSFRATSSSSM